MLLFDFEVMQIDHSCSISTASAVERDTSISIGVLAGRWVIVKSQLGSDCLAAESGVHSQNDSRNDLR